MEFQPRADFWGAFRPDTREALRTSARSAQWKNGASIPANVADEGAPAIAILRTGLAIARTAHTALRLYGAGDIVGYEPGPRPARPTPAGSVFATETCFGMTIARDRFLSIVDENHDTAVLQRLLADRLHEADLLHEAATRDPEYHIAAGLLLLVERFGSREGGGKVLKIERDDLAGLLSVSESKLNRQLRGLHTADAAGGAHLVVPKRGRVFVPDVARLHRHVFAIEAAGAR